MTGRRRFVSLARLSRFHATLTGAFVLGFFAAAAAVLAAASAGDVALFERLDADGDGVVSAHETRKEHRRLFERLLRRAGMEPGGSLARADFLAALVPSRPEKPVEVKQPAALPGSDAVRYLLLTADTNLDSVIEADEVPDDFRRLFAVLVERLDRNDNGALEPIELRRGGRPLAQVAGRYVESRRIDVAAELKKLEKAQGKAARRFDDNRRPGALLGDPRQARALFARLDANGDKRLDADEVPEAFQPQFERFLRVADRDGDGGLSEREFLIGAERVSRFMSQKP